CHTTCEILYRDGHQGRKIEGARFWRPGYAGGGTAEREKSRHEGDLFDPGWIRVSGRYAFRGGHARDRSAGQEERSAMFLQPGCPRILDIGGQRSLQLV